MGLEDEEVFDFAKSTRSLKRASSGFCSLVGVDEEFRERFWVCPTKLSWDELDPLLEWDEPFCSKNCCLWLYFEGGGGMTTGACVSQGAGGSCSDDLGGDGSSYIGCLLKIGEEVLVALGWGEDSVGIVDEAGLELEWRGAANEVGSEFSKDPSALYASPLR